MARKGRERGPVPGAFGRDRGRRPSGFSSLRDALQGALGDEENSGVRRRDERPADPWSILAQAATERLRFAFLGYFPSPEGKLLAYEAGSEDGFVRVVAATPDIQAQLGSLPKEFAFPEIPASISGPMAEMQHLEGELGGPLSFWHEVDDLIAKGEAIRIGLPAMEDPTRPHRRGPFGFAFQRDPKGAVRVISVFNPRGLPGAPRIGETLDDIGRKPNPSVGRKLLALTERWGYRLSEAVARRTR